MRIAVLLAVLLVGLFFLPAWGFAAFAACLLLGLPTARWPRAYRALSRAIAAPIIAGIGFLCSWGVKVAIDGGSPLPLAQLAPPLGAACEQSRQVLEVLSTGVSPACRLLLDDPRREYGFGLFLELLMLINLVCIRRLNLQPSLRESDARLEGAAAVLFFAVYVATLSFVAQLVDAELASLIDGPFVVPAVVSYLAAALYILCASALQVSLYPARKRTSGL